MKTFPCSPAPPSLANTARTNHLNPIHPGTYSENHPSYVIKPCTFSRYTAIVFSLSGGFPLMKFAGTQPTPKTKLSASKWRQPSIQWRHEAITSSKLSGGTDKHQPWVPSTSRTAAISELSHIWRMTCKFLEFSRTWTATTQLVESDPVELSIPWLCLIDLSLWKWQIMIGGLNSMRSNSFLDFKGIILDCR